VCKIIKCFARTMKKWLRRQSVPMRILKVITELTPTLECLIVIKDASEQVIERCGCVCTVTFIVCARAISCVRYTHHRLAMRLNCAVSGGCFLVIKG